jgi:hypothetical protein
MKKTLIILLLAFGAVQAATIIVPKLKPAKDEHLTQVEVKTEILPEVIVNGTSTGIRGYSAKFTVEIGEFCPRDNPTYKVEQEQSNFQENSEGQTVFVKHCKKCNTGAYLEHSGENGRSCTFCGDKEESN